MGAAPSYYSTFGMRSYTPQPPTTLQPSATFTNPSRPCRVKVHRHAYGYWVSVCDGCTTTLLWASQEAAQAWKSRHLMAAGKPTDEKASNKP